MKSERSRFVLLVASVIAVLVTSRHAHARPWGGQRTAYAYAYTDDAQVVWEDDDGSKSFLLFPEIETRHHHYEGVRLGQLSRPMQTPFAFGQLAPIPYSSVQPAWVIYDVRAKALVLSTQDEAVARQRFTELARSPPRMLIAGDGAPARPVLWRTADSLAETVTGEAVGVTLISGFLLFPVYLIAMWCYIAAVRHGFRRDASSRALATCAAVLTSPCVPYLGWVAVLLLRA